MKVEYKYDNIVSALVEYQIKTLQSMKDIGEGHNK